MAKNKVKSKNRSAGPRRKRAANETRLANHNKAAKQLHRRYYGEDTAEFVRRYNDVLSMGETAEKEQTSEAYAALLGGYEELAEWLQQHHKYTDEPEWVDRVHSLNEHLRKRMLYRMRVLKDRRESGADTPLEREEMAGWKRLYQVITPPNEERTLHDMLAEEGVELHTGKNDDGEDIVWTEPLGGAADEAPAPQPPTGPVATTRNLFQLLDEAEKLDEVCRMKLADKELLKQVRKHSEQINALLRSGDNIPAVELLERHEELAKIVAKAVIAEQPLLPEDDGISRNHSGWHEVVDLQNDMIRFWASPFGRAYGSAWGQSMIGASEKNNTEAPVPGWTTSKMQWALQLGRIEQAKLMMADPMYINDEVQQLIAASVDDWPASPLRREDVFPSFYGFAVFPRPFVVIDTQGKRVAFRALAWEPLGPKGEIQFEPNAMQINPKDASGLFISGYAHADDPDDYPLMQTIEAMRGRLKVPITAPPVMSLSYATPWHFEQNYALDENDAEKRSPLPIDLTGSGLDRFCRILRVMWTLAQQKITATPRTQLPRAQRKRAERSELQSDVLVVKLRQTSAPKKEGDETSVEWQCRWRVRTHWRDQWYPAEQRHKPILIFSYMKGPDDKPLKIKPFRAYEFRR